MHDRVFGTTDVIIYRQPEIDFSSSESFLVIMRIGKTQEIPAGTGKAIHGVGFTLSLAATFWTFNVHKLRHVSQWPTTITSRFELFEFGQLNRQLIFRHGHYTTFLAVDNWDWCAPITLAADQPITDFVVNAFPAKILGHFFSGFSGRRSE